MTKLKLETVVSSAIDKTQKFIFTSGLTRVLEVSYIDKDDGKDILCVPTESGCAQGCLFCHMTGSSVPVLSLSEEEILQAVQSVRLRLNLTGEKPLLVSYMGCGEPLCNWYQVAQSMSAIHTACDNSRFALATILPKDHEAVMLAMGKYVKFNNLNLKIHLSLHFTTDELRHKWLPSAGDLIPSLQLLRWYRDYTGNKIEIHYTPINGVNDSYEDARRLVNLIGEDKIPIKLLTFNPKPGLLAECTDSMRNFKLWSGWDNVEIYTPPGRDIGASCGQFDLKYYGIKHYKPTEKV